jgi:putative ABC transport system permease protein
MNDFMLVFKNLFRRKLRAALMIFSIFIAFAIFGVLASFERAFNAGQDLAAADRLVTVNKINFTQPLPYSYYGRVAGMEGVKRVTFANWFGGYFQDPKNFLITFAVEPRSYMDVMAEEFDIPPEQQRAFVRTRTGALVGETVANKYGWKIGDRVPIASSIFSQLNGARSWDFDVVGIVKPKKPLIDTNFVLFQYEYFNETRSFGKDQIGWLVLQTTSPAINDKVIKTIDETFANSSFETATDTEKAFNKAFMAQLGNIALIVTLVVGAAFVTILMIVGNTMMMAIRERAREIAVLKALGFPGTRVLRLVLGETLLLALIGGLAGIGAAALVTKSMRDSLANFVPGLSLGPQIVALALVLMLALGLATGLMPALNALRLKIAVGLGRG